MKVFVTCGQLEIREVNQLFLLVRTSRPYLESDGCKDSDDLLGRSSLNSC